MRAAAKKKDGQWVPEAPKGKQVRCACGRLGVLVERDRLTIFEGEEEPWTSFGEEPNEGRVVLACDDCQWAGTFIKGAEGYTVDIKRGRKVIQRVKEEFLEGGEP
jgi:hypothetical protein